MIDANIIFRRRGGAECSSAELDEMSTQDFYSAWAAGDLYRDIAVTIQNTDLVTEGLQDPRSAAFKLIGTGATQAWAKLDQQLALVPQLLSMYVHQPGEQLVTDIDSDDMPLFAITADAHADRTKAGDRKLYAPYYYLEAKVLHEPAWYRREPTTVLHDMVLELLQRLTVRDNATLLFLLNTACGHTNEIYSADQFSPVLFSSMRTAIQRWKIATPCCLATARALSRLDLNEHAGDLTKQPSALDAAWGHLAETALYCLGSPHDIMRPRYDNEGAREKDLFLCGPSDILGARSRLMRVEGYPINKELLGVDQHGWYWYCYISTQITNSRAVVAATLKAG